MILKIEAKLSSGFCATFDFGLAIDGIIGHQSQLEKLGFDEFVLTQSAGYLAPLDDLPIEKEHFGDDWWYQCSRPFFHCPLVHQSHIHRRFNAIEAERYVAKAGVIQTTKGAYKNARLPLRGFMTNSVVWYVNGDRERITELLQGVTHIGAKRSIGRGRVKQWIVSEHDNLDDCRFKRALPIEFAQKHGIDGMRLEWAIRPPSNLPSNKRLCVCMTTQT